MYPSLPSPRGSSCRDTPHPPQTPLYVLGCCEGVPSSLLQEKGLDFFQSSLTGQVLQPFGSSVSPSFGSSPVSLLRLWTVGTGTVTASRAGGQAGDTSPQPGTPSGLHTVLAGLSSPHCPGVTSSDTQSITQSLLTPPPRVCPTAACLCKHCSCVPIITLSASLFRLPLTSHLEFVCFRQPLQPRKVGRQFSTT